MIIQCGGRGGSDFKNEYITDWDAYSKALLALVSLYDKEESGPIFNPDEDIFDLTEFYGCSLDRFYDSKLQPKYKVGDIVKIMVLENHLNYTKDKILTRVKIEKVNPLNPHHTYRGTQIDRRWDNFKIIDDVGNGSIGAAFNDTEVKELL